jgi:hypothetical protein
MCTGKAAIIFTRSKFSYLSNSKGFGGGVDGNEDEISFLDGRIHVGREEEITPSAFLHHFI